MSFYLQSLKPGADNAAMIAWASMHRFLAGDHDDYTVDLCAKWSIEHIR
jgi:N6-L-threonylcarbamoyladenine synthase